MALQFRKSASLLSSLPVSLSDGIILCFSSSLSLLLLDCMCVGTFVLLSSFEVEGGFCSKVFGHASFCRQCKTADFDLSGIHFDSNHQS